MSEQQAAPPQYSPDGRWWWNGQEWVPVPAKRGRNTAKIVLAVVVGVLVLIVVAVLALGSLLMPVGTQHDSSEVEGYCEIFPEDC